MSKPIVFIQSSLDPTGKTVYAMGINPNKLREFKTEAEFTKAIADCLATHEKGPANVLELLESKDHIELEVELSPACKQWLLNDA